MTTETPDVKELVAVALSRSDLTLRRGRCGLDKIIALALAELDVMRSWRGRGAMARSAILNASEAVFGLKYALDGRRYRSGLAFVRRVARALAARHNWRAQRGKRAAQLEALAKEVLDYWLNDVCPVCEGREFERDEGAPFLRAKACQHCGGTGKRPYPWGASQRHKIVLKVVEEIEDVVARLVARRLWGRHRAAPIQEHVSAVPDRQDRSSPAVRATGEPNRP